MLSPSPLKGWRAMIDFLILNNETLLQPVLSAITEYHPGGSLTVGFYFSQFRRLVSPHQGSGRTGVWGGPLPGSQMAPSFL